jgi:hypothetical protein
MYIGVVGVTGANLNINGTINGITVGSGWGNYSYNTAIGYQALSYNTGNYNTGIGLNALNNNSGSFNTVIGANDTPIQITGSNNTLIGYGANIDPSFSNVVVIGNIGIQAAFIKVAWSYFSDKRLKSNIQNSNLGLDFISKLRPVSYHRNNDASQKTEYGLIAQELEETLNSAGVTNNGIISKDGEGMYSVRYNDLISPMIKAIQEQKTIIDNQQLQIDELKKMVESMLKK